MSVSKSCLHSLLQIAANEKKAHENWVRFIFSCLFVIFYNNLRHQSNMKFDKFKLQIEYGPDARDEFFPNLKCLKKHVSGLHSLCLWVVKMHMTLLEIFHVTANMMFRDRSAAQSEIDNLLHHGQLTF